MKVMFNFHFPYMLAHGGGTIQIEQTMAALQKIGVPVEPVRWWDEAQTGDIFHHFGRIPFTLLDMAHQKGLKVVFTDFLGNLGSRPQRKLTLQRIFIRLMQRTLPPSRIAGLNWESFRRADACIALTAWEAHLMSYMFDSPPDRVHIVANGVEEVFFRSACATRGQWLVCTATIRDIKRNVELAEAAIEAQTPVWIVGKAYTETDPYAQRFFELAQQNPKFVRYEGAIENREALARVYREARGFVLLSAYESLSLSALEAAACECPLLLSDLPWARSVFKDGATYCPVGSRNQTAAALRRFYDAAPTSKLAETPMTWVQVAEQLAGIYRSLLKAS